MTSLRALSPRPDDEGVPALEGDRPVTVIPFSGRPRPRSRRRWVRAVLLALLVGGAVTVAGYALAGDSGAAEGLGPGRARVQIGIHHSRFQVEAIRVHQGTLLEIEVRNDDPIDHELVVGTEEVHARHRTGTERRHPPVPGEVSVAPGRTGLTFIELDEPGTYEFVCHLPGHEAYGMKGTIEVLPGS